MAGDGRPRIPLPHPSPEELEEQVYKVRDSLSASFKGAGVLGGVGLFAAAVQATLTKQNIGALGTFTRYGGTIGQFAAIGFTYEFARSAAANFREREDLYNPAIGGFLAGGVLGLHRRTIASVLAHGVGASVLAAVYYYQGSSLFGLGRDPHVDEFERKQALRENVRRPIGETLTELGEGRGIYGPGYAERRRERIQDNLGVDVGEDASSPSRARSS